MTTVRDHRARLTFALLLSMPALIAGCGSGDDDSSVSGNSSSTNSLSSGTTAPSIELAGTPPTSVTAGITYVFQPTVSTSSGTATFSAMGLPSWATLNQATGEIFGTPSSGQLGSTGDIVITATDGTATASLAAFKIDVLASGAQTDSVSLSWSAPTENTNGTPVTGLGGYHIHYGTSAGGLTAEIVVPGASTTSYEISNLTSGTYYFSISAYNSMGEESPPSAEASATI
jgi:hypothetical protein